MLHYFEQGGWGMYPVFAFGIATLIVAGRQLLRHDPRRNLTAMWLMALTVMAGVLGTATGMQTSSSALHTTNEKWIWFLGLQESLNNLVSAGVMVNLAILMMLAAHLRAAPPAGESTARRRARRNEDDSPETVRAKLVAV